MAYPAETIPADLKWLQQNLYVKLELLQCYYVIDDTVTASSPKLP